MEKQQDEIYCPECGKPVKNNAVVCPHCGIQIKELTFSTAPTSIKIEPAASPKSKNLSVVLAVFFGPVSWLYTFRKDQIKFWSCLGLMIVIWFSFGGYSNWIYAVYAIGYFWALIDAVRRPLNFYYDYPNG